MAMALDDLGPDRQFATEFGLDQPVEEGRAHYHGDLILRSAGDPTMGGPFFTDAPSPVDLLESWVARLREAGIAFVHGNLVLDASAFGSGQLGYPEVWEPHHRSYAYAAIPSALTINENVVRVSVRPGAASGSPGRITLFPSGEGLTVLNNVLTRGSGSSGIELKFAEDPRTLSVGGRVLRSQREEVAVTPLPRPLEYIGVVMQGLLERQGITLNGTLLIKTEPDTVDQRPQPLAVVLGRHESPPLNRLLVEMMRYSDNFLAEQIWAGTVAHVAGRGDRATARRIEQGWLASLGMSWVEPGWDGCGLSRENLFSARQLVMITRHLFESPWRELTLEALPMDGVRGTLRGRAFASGGGRVIAKTGTINGVSGLTGYILDKQKRPRLVFSMIGNAPGNTDGRLALRINELVKLLIARMDAGSYDLAEPIDNFKRSIEKMVIVGNLPALPAQR
jgi:D-alanyl-D-alanine carboxypeptidase/D-alanyl-D-alanine-endopeptidase (penicillin-binding protein 4)